MNRNVLNRIGVIDIPPFEHTRVEFDKVSSETDQIFGLIFAPDPVSGLPRNDISVFLSDKSSSQVREFIQNQLHQDFVPEVSVPKGLSDDDIAFCTRKSDETIEMYAKRMNGYIAHQRQQILMAEQKSQKVVPKSE